MAELNNVIGKDFMRQESTNILRYLPAFVSETSNTFKTIGDSQSAEHDRLKEYMLDIYKQFFISTATWGLTLWEKDLFLPIIETDSYENRRLRIWNKLQAKQTSTLQFMTDLLNNYVSTKDGKITELYDTYTLRFEVQDGTINNWTDLLDAINQWKPAHLAYFFNTYLNLGEEVYFSGIVTEVEEIYIPADTDYIMKVDKDNTESAYIPKLVLHGKF
jgi:hypothetical protein